MQKIVFFLLIIGSVIKVFSQQEFFVYIQADNHQPFYARINKKIYSSSETGYMVIPKLNDSTYEFMIGFAKNAFPEQRFSVNINKKDKGFQLKNLGEKGWALVNLQNMSVIMNTGIASKPVPELAGIRKTDAFSELLANVVNDTAILYSAVKMKPPETVAEKTPSATSIKTENKQEKDLSASANAGAAILKKETDKPGDSVSKPVTVTNPITNPKVVPEKSESIIKGSVLKKPDTKPVIDAVTNNKAIVEKPFITRIAEKKSGEMYEAIYLEQYNFTTDTIKISILLNESRGINPSPLPPVIEKRTDPVSEKTNIIEEKTTALKPVVIDSTASSNRVIQIINSDCKNFATDYDVDKLRVKLIDDKTIDDKLSSAKKYYKNKCMSVKQIKALTELFPSDETKYRFFELSYPFVSDPANFYKLGEMIENDYFKNRFKAMVIK